MTQEIFTVHGFCDEDGNDTDFAGCSLVLGELTGAGGWPVAKEWFATEPTIGETFAYRKFTMLEGLGA